MNSERTLDNPGAWRVPTASSYAEINHHAARPGSFAPRQPRKC